MSRSYRAAWITDGYKGSITKQFKKRQANKKIRRTKEIIQDGKAYRKFYDTWNICDYKYPIDIKDDWYKEKFWRYIRK